MNRKTVQFISDCTAFFDLSHESTALHRIIICILLLNISNIQMIIYAFKNIDNVYKFAYPISNFLLASIMLCYLGSFLRKNKDIQLLLKYIDQHVYTYSDESNIHPTYAWMEREENILRIFLLICKCNAFIMVCVGLSPCIQLIIFGKVENIIYPSWIPWKVNGIVLFVCGYLVNLCPVLAGYFSFNICLIFPLFVTLEFRRQRKRLCTALLSINKRSEEYIRASKKKRKHRTRSVPKPGYHEILKYNIIDCIKHHQTLLRTFKLFRSWWAPAFSVQLAISIVEVSLSIFVCMKTAEPLLLANITGTTWCCIVGLLLNCYIGEEFSMLNEEISKTIFYEMEWHEKESDIRQLLTMFHLLVVRHPFTLKGLLIFEASYQTFSYVCRKSYSCLNLMIA